MEKQYTILGTEITEDIRGIVYLCYFDHDKMTLTVCNSILCQSTSKALNLYANIPNPESQLVMGDTYEELITNLNKLHEDIKDPVWLEELSNCI